MKVLLMRPIESRVAKSGDVMPPLGLAYIASVLEKEGMAVKVLDCPALRPSLEEMRQGIKKENPDVLGISCMTTVMPSAMKIANLAKEILPDCVIILGGPHVTALPKEALLENPNVDVVVVGEGENTMLELCRSLINENSLDIVLGIAFRKSGKIIVTPPRPLIGNLDEIPFPARHLLPMEKYSMATSKRSPCTTMIASRGCPYLCKYCSSHIIHGRRIRIRSVDNVLSEIKYVQDKYRVKDIAFMDDTFTVKWKWVHEFCDEIVNEKVDVSWQCQTSVKNVNYDLLLHMKKAGCYMINYGVEFGSQRILDATRKGIKLDEVERAFRLTNKVGIATYAYFMMGYPGENIADIRKTMKLSRTLNLDFVQFSIYTPFPGSESYNEHHDMIKDRDWGSFDYAYTPVIETGGFSRGDILKLYNQAYREFYIRPSYIFKRLISIRSYANLKNKLSGGMALLRFLLKKGN
ncbi:MAG: B12-binding domain-containing radical SAM protein [Candidatus Bathyarchaeia archaeon]